MATLEPRRGDRRIALLLGLLATLVVLAGGRGQGFTRDEGYYIDAGELYYGWYGEIGDGLLEGKPLKAFNRASIDRWFGYNHEHPALLKTLFGFSWRLLHKCSCPEEAGRHPIHYPKRHRTLGLLSGAEAARFPADLCAGLTVALTYLFGARAWSRRAGLVAAVLALAAPRIFFHSQLACFDAPVVTTWLLSVYTYWRSLHEPRYAKWAGVAFGLAMATKHNAFFLPFLFLGHYLWVRRDRLRRLRLPPIPLAFVYMATLGPLIEFLHWPWLWFDTIPRFGEYLGFHLHHVYYNMEYLGLNYNKPPFPMHFPLLMTLFTAPVTTLVLGLGGLAALAIDRRPEEPLGEGPPRWTAPALGLAPGTALLVVSNTLFPPAIIAFTGAPIFGATKHWLAAIPFLALLAGYALHRLLDWLAARYDLAPRSTLGLSAVAVLLAWAPAIAETWRSHPYGLSHYNLLAGGPAGGADLGLNRQFWGYASRGLLSWIDQHAAPNAPIYWHDTNQSILNLNVREKLMRGDLGNTGLEEPGVKASDLAMVIHEKHFNKYEYWIWDFYGTSRPQAVLTHEGVPIVTLYERPRTP